LVDVGRLTLHSPLVSVEATVRELHLADAQLLADAARDMAHMRGPLPIPSSLDDALRLVTQFETLRAAELGNLFGVWGPGDSELVGAASILLSEPDDQVAEGAMWARPDRKSRYAMAHGVDLIVQEIHNTMQILRVWVSMDSIDPLARHLLWSTMFNEEAEIRHADGSVTVRYSSIARART
jgi:hypothetical protein